MCQVSGTVRFRQSGEPVAGISVTAYDSHHLDTNTNDGYPPTCETDAEGEYTLAGLPPTDRCRIVAEDLDRGYIAVEMPILKLAPGEHQTGVDLLVSEGSSVSGRLVFRNSGAPVPDVRMAFRGIPLQRETVTATDGSYTFSTLPSGPCTVVCLGSTATAAISPPISASRYHTKTRRTHHGAGFRGRASLHRLRVGT